LVAGYLENASERLKIFNFDSPAKHLKDIELPGIGTIPVSSGGNTDAEIFFKFSQFTDPGSTFRLDMNTFELEAIRATNITHLGMNLTDFTTDQVWYESKDGTKVPMFIIRKKSVLGSLDEKPKAPIPTILYGYGGFNSAKTPSFNLMNLIFLNNLNGLYVVANIRGGGEFGEQWHLSAVQQNKQKSYDDFIAAAEYLQSHGYTDSAHLVINGASNGGTLVAVSAN